MSNAHPAALARFCLTTPLVQSHVEATRLSVTSSHLPFTERPFPVGGTSSLVLAALSVLTQSRLGRPGVAPSPLPGPAPLSAALASARPLPSPRLASATDLPPLRRTFPPFAALLMPCVTLSLLSSPSALSVSGNGRPVLFRRAVRARIESGASEAGPGLPRWGHAARFPGLYS